MESLPKKMLKMPSLYYSVCLCALRRWREAMEDNSVEGTLRSYGEKATVSAALSLMAGFRTRGLR